jgi:hypothetical protein
MAIPHAQPGETIDVHPLGAALAETKTHALFKTKGVEVVRAVMPKGKVIPDLGRDHRAVPRRRDHPESDEHDEDPEGRADGVLGRWQTSLGGVHRGRFVLVDDRVGVVS